MQGRLCIYHLHSDLSNATTTIDSTTKFQSYIDRAKECGMTALGFSEHGLDKSGKLRQRSTMRHLHASPRTA